MAGGFLDVNASRQRIYTLMVDPSLAQLGQVTLNVYAVPQDVTAALPASGAPVRVSTTAPGQNARFTFSAAAGSMNALNLGSVTIPDYSYVTVVAPDGNTIAANSVSQAGSTFIELPPLPATGVYTVLVDPTVAYTGSVSASVFSIAPVVTAMPSAGTPSITGVTIPGQTAHRTFAGTAGQRVSVRITDVTMTSAQVFLLDPVGTVVLSVTFGTYGAFFDVQTLSMNGIYTIVVDPAGVYTGRATLTLIQVPADIGAVLATSGVPARVTTTVPGQNARLTFGGVAGRLFTLNLSNITIPDGTRVDVLGPAGDSLVATNVYPGALWYVDVSALPETGVYTVVVDPSLTGVGSMTLALYPATGPSSAIAVGVPLTVTTGAPGQAALRTFSGVAGQRVSVRVTDVTYSAAAVDLLRPDGSLLASSYVAGGGGFVDTATLDTTGTYTFASIRWCCTPEAR